MKRIDITAGTYYEVIDKLDLRPSVKNIIHDELFHYKIGHVYELCSKTEEELHALQILPAYLIDPIKKRLEEVGLKLGMTQRELTDYMDADYLEEKARRKEAKEGKDSKEPDYSESESTEDGYISIKEEEWKKLKEEKDKLEEKANRWGLFIPWSTLFFIFLIIPPAFSLGYFIHQAFFKERTTPSTEYNLRDADDERLKRLEDRYCLYTDSAHSGYELDMTEQ